MRRLILPPLLLLLSASMGTPDRGQPGTQIRATALPLDPADPARRQAGALRYLGGWVLRSGDARFGGISAMAVDGDRLLMVSDTGRVIRLRLNGGVPGPATIAALPNGPGRGSAKADRDAEAMTVDRRGRVWVAFEGHNAVWRYDAELTAAEAERTPAAMRDWPANGGAEAMVRLADGRFVIFAETAPAGDGATAALLFPGDPTAGAVAPVAFRYRPPMGFSATDAAQLPDGRLLILNRHFSLRDGVAAALTIVDPKDIAPGALLTGREIARLAPPLSVDNMEAMAIVRTPDGTILWIASDDNFNPLQRTLLMKFALPDRF